MFKMFLIAVVLSMAAAQQKGSEFYPSDYDSSDRSSYPSSNRGSYPSPNGGSNPSKKQETYPSYDRPSGSYPSYDSPSGSYPSYDSPSGSYPKGKPTTNYADPPPNYKRPNPGHSYGYTPPLKAETYISPVSHSHSISPPYSNPYSKGGPTYSTHTSQTFIASLHP